MTTRAHAMITTTKTATGVAKRVIITFEMIAPTIQDQKIIGAAITASAETNAAEMGLGAKVADGARGTVLIIETETDAAIGNRNRDRDRNRDTRGRHRESRQSHRREIFGNETRSNNSSLASPIVSFEQVRDSISRGSRRLRNSAIDSRQYRSCSRRSIINSRPSHSFSRSSSVDSGEVSALHSYSAVQYSVNFCSKGSIHR